jgi:hypothetical protein
VCTRACVCACMLACCGHKSTVKSPPHPPPRDRDSISEQVPSWNQPMAYLAFTTELLEVLGARPAATGARVVLTHRTAPNGPKRG